jgi:hypothetical protein
VWSDQDTNINHGAYAAAVLGGPAFQQIVQSGFGAYATGVYAGWQEDRCGVHGGHQCTATATDVALGDQSRVFGGCAWNPGTIPIAPSVGAIRLGPDTRRTLTCFVTLHIEPAAAYQPVQSVGPYVTIYAPTSGSLTYHPEPIPGFAAVARQRPAIAPVTTSVAGPGPVKVKLRLNAAAKRILQRRHKLPVSLDMTFTPTAGPAVTRTTRVTLRSAPTPPKRCAVHKPTRNRHRLQKACHIWRHA